MTTPTEAQKMRLAEASLRLAREALRGVPTDLARIMQRFDGYGALGAALV